MAYLQIFLNSQDDWPDSLDYLGQFFLIIIMIVIIGLMAYLSFKLMSASRLGGKLGAMRNLQIIESIGVGVQSSVQIVRGGDKYYMLGVTKEHITFLTEVDKETLKLPEVKNPLENNPFDKVLKRFIKRDVEKDTENDG